MCASSKWVLRRVSGWNFKRKHVETCWNHHLVYPVDHAQNPQPIAQFLLCSVFVYGTFSYILTHECSSRFPALLPLFYCQVTLDCNSDLRSSTARSHWVLSDVQDFPQVRPRVDGFSHWTEEFYRQICMDFCCINFVARYCCWFRNPAITTWDIWSPMNNEINYQPQLISRTSAINNSRLINNSC